MFIELRIKKHDGLEENILININQIESICVINKETIISLHDDSFSVLQSYDEIKKLLGPIRKSDG